MTSTLWNNVSSTFKALQLFGGINGAKIKTNVSNIWIVQEYKNNDDNYGYLLSDGNFIIRFYDDYQFILLPRVDKFYIIDIKNNCKAGYLLSGFEYYNKSIKKRLIICNYIKNKLMDIQIRYPRPFNHEYYETKSSSEICDISHSSGSFDSDTSETSETSSSTTETCLTIKKSLTYIVCSEINDDLSIYNLNNGVIQARFRDNVDIILSDNARSVCVINSEGAKIKFPLFSVIEWPIPSLISNRLQILINKCLVSSDKT
jgi:hypothetical protein